VHNWSENDAEKKRKRKKLAELFIHFEYCPVKRRKEKKREKRETYGFAFQQSWKKERQTQKEKEKRNTRTEKSYGGFFSLLLCPASFFVLFYFSFLPLAFVDTSLFQSLLNPSKGESWWEGNGREGRRVPRSRSHEPLVMKLTLSSFFFLSPLPPRSCFCSLLLFAGQ
jgi:hypothetical protein